jgi:pilus assembly protein Flp/PilA
MRLLRSILRDERGAAAIEYGLIIAVLSLAMIAGFSAFSDSLVNMFNFISGKLAV